MQKKYLSNLTAISMALLPLPLLLYLLSRSLALATGCRLRILCWLRSVIELHYAGDIGHSLRRSPIIPRIEVQEKRKEEERDREKGKRGSCVRVSTRLSRLQNFIGDYHNVACPWPGSIVVLSPFWALSAFAARICARRGVDFRGSLPETKVQMQIQIPVADLGFSLCYARCRCRLRRRDG